MSEEKPIVVYTALAANVGIAVAKLVVATISGSSAMFAEGIHSVADTGNEILLLVGLRRSRRRPDRECRMRAIGKSHSQQKEESC